MIRFIIRYLIVYVTYIVEDSYYFYDFYDVSVYIMFVAKTNTIVFTFNTISRALPLFIP